MAKKKIKLFEVVRVGTVSPALYTVEFKTVLDKNGACVVLGGRFKRPIAKAVKEHLEESEVISEESFPTPENASGALLDRFPFIEGWLRSLTNRGEFFDYETYVLDLEREAREQLAEALAIHDSLDHIKGSLV